MLEHASGQKARFTCQLELCLIAPQSSPTMPLSPHLVSAASLTPSQARKHASRPPRCSCAQHYSPCTVPISPPACALVAPAASLTLAAAELAELWTLERPSEALDDACAAFSFTTPVASAVVEALRMPARRTANVDCRSTARDAARDIVKSAGGVEMADGDGVDVVMSKSQAR